MTCTGSRCRGNSRLTPIGADVLENNIATRKDFEAAHEASRRVERVILPKLGKAVLLRRPAPLWFIFHGALPKSLAVAAISGKKCSSGPQCAAGPEDLELLARWIVALLGEVVVQPRVSLSPGPDEIPPEAIEDADLQFILRFAMGEVAGDGADSPTAGGLARFRNE